LTGAFGKTIACFTFDLERPGKIAVGSIGLVIADLYSRNHHKRSGFDRS